MIITIKPSNIVIFLITIYSNKLQVHKNYVFKKYLYKCLILDKNIYISILIC